MAVSPQTTVPDPIIDGVTDLDADSVMPKFTVIADNYNTHTHTEYDTIAGAQAKADAAQANAIADAHTYTDTQIAAGRALLPVTTKTSSWTVLDTDFIVLADATSGALSITLPTAATRTGRSFVIKRINPGANAVTVVAQSGETLDGSNLRILNFPYDAVQVVSNGINWFIL